MADAAPLIEQNIIVPLPPGGTLDFSVGKGSTTLLAANPQIRKIISSLCPRPAKQQQAAIGGLGAAVEIYCEFLAFDG
jgi:hypothetical protein